MSKFLTAQDLYPLPDSLYPGSKDWQAGSYKERVEWLHLMYESAKQEVARLESQQEQPSKTERQIRRMFCVTYASDSSPYMDDGEAQDNSRHPCIDFLRDSPEQIQSKMVERAIAKHKAQQEQPASVDAYVGAREDAAIWKKRALEAEELNRKFIADVNGPTYLGEPVKQEHPAQEPVAYCVSGQVTNWARDFSKYKTQHYTRPVYTHPAPTQPALSDASIDAAIEAWFTTEIGGVKGHPFRNRMKAAIEAHCRGGADK